MFILLSLVRLHGYKPSGHRESPRPRGIGSAITLRRCIQRQVQTLSLVSRAHVARLSDYSLRSASLCSSSIEDTENPNREPRARA